MRYQVTIEHSFEAAHRLLDHSGKCKHLHGHSYRAVITVDRMHLNVNGMVVDFGELKRTLGVWIDSNWDHNILLQIKDPLNALYFSSGDTSIKQSQMELSEGIFKGKEPYTFTQPPTAEVLSKELIEIATTILRKVDEESIIGSVTIFETAKCSATTMGLNR